MYAYRYGEISEARKVIWDSSDENPYNVLKWHKKIECADGISFLSIANEYLRERVQIDWGSFAWKGTKTEILELVSHLTCGKIESPSCMEDDIEYDIEYGVVFIEDAF